MESNYAQDSLVLLISLVTRALQAKPRTQLTGLIITVDARWDQEVLCFSAQLECLVLGFCVFVWGGYCLHNIY